MSCHDILKNLYEPKMDVILTISFKISNSGNRDKKTYVLRRISHTRCIGFVKRAMYVLSFIHFFTVNSLVNAAQWFNGVCRRTFHWKGIKLDSSPWFVTALMVYWYGKVALSRRRRVRVLLSTLSLFLLSFFFPPFLCCFVCLFVLLFFYKYIAKLRNCYWICYL